MLERIIPIHSPQEQLRSRAGLPSEFPDRLHLMKQIVVLTLIITLVLFASVATAATPVAKIRIQTPSPSTATVGSSSFFNVQAFDASNNLASTSSLTVTLAFSGSAVGLTTVTLTSGSGSSFLTDTVAETVTVSIVSCSISGLDLTSTQQVVFNPGKL